MNEYLKITNEYLKYISKVMSVQDLEKYKKAFEEDIAQKQRDLSEFLDKGNERIKQVEEYEKNKQYCILGSTYREGKTKRILIIIRYVDKTQRDERYSFNKITDLRVKLTELKQKYSGVDWSDFREEI